MAAADFPELAGAFLSWGAVWLRHRGLGVLKERIAEELGVDLKQVRPGARTAQRKLYANPLLGVHATGNSNAIRGAWQPLRRAGATAKAMLVAATAR
jgi:hypothetical protein